MLTAKSRKYRGNIVEVYSPEKSQGLEKDWSQVEQMQVPNGTGPGQRYGSCEIILETFVELS